MKQRLTERKIERAKAGRHTHVFGLSLLVRGGSKIWQWRGTVRGTGQQVSTSLGSAHEIPLDEAEEIALKYRRMVRKGINPIQQADTVKAPAPTVADAIGKVIETKRGEWKDAEKMETRWRTVSGKAASIINRPVDAVGTGDVRRRC